MPFAIALFFQLTTAARCEVDVHGNFCQSGAANRVSAYCPNATEDEHLLLDSLLAREHRESAIAGRPKATAQDWGHLACTFNGILEHPYQSIDSEYKAEFRNVEPTEKAIEAALEAVRRSPLDPEYLRLLTAMAFRLGPGSPELRRYGINTPGLAVNPGWSVYLFETLGALASAVRDSSATVHLRSCTSLALAIGEYGTAHDCILRSLALGRDSTWNLLRLAWLAFHREDRATGTQLFSRAVDAARDRRALIDLGWHFKKTPDEWTPWGSGARDDRQPDVARERLAWLSLSHDSLLPWIDNRAQTKGGAKLWSALNTEEALARHFASVTFWGDRFRDCFDQELRPPCNTTRAFASLSARRLQFWNDSGGRIVVLPYRFTSGPGTSTSPMASFALRQWDATQRAVRDSTWTSALGRSDSTAMHRGLVVSSGSSAFTSWRLSITRATRDTASDFQDLQPGIENGLLSISDVTIGPVGGSTLWTHAGENTPVTTDDTFDHNVPVILYYQMRCTASCGTTRTAIALFGLATRTPTKPALYLAMSSTVSPGVQSVEREVDMSRLKAGTYRLEVTVTDERGRSVGSRSVLLSLH